MACHFLNADLDVFSAGPLDGLIHEIGDRALLLEGGPHSEETPFFARYEIDDQVATKTPETLAAAFCGLIEGLSPTARHQWTLAARRVLDLGYEVDQNPDRIEGAITASTLGRLAALDITLAWTFYPAEAAG